MQRAILRTSPLNAGAWVGIQGSGWRKAYSGGGILLWAMYLAHRIIMSAMLRIAILIVRYREIVVFDEDQVYPAYICRYQRVK